jgi:ABC-type nickel/cobalt efflux system permease component RcnA
MENREKAAKSLMYTTFIAWRMYTKEKHLLRMYLKESEADEHLAYTPDPTYRPAHSVQGHSPHEHEHEPEDIDDFDESHQDNLSTP